LERRLTERGIMGLEANRMRFNWNRGFQSGLFGAKADRMRSHGTGGKQNEFFMGQEASS
jgi:hypothetical protein